MMEIVRKVEDVTSLKDNIHWFCPRADEENDIFFDEDFSIHHPTYLEQESDTERKKRQAQIEEASQRTDRVLDACTIFAFDGDDARPFQEKLRDGLAAQLVRCDVCVREYHRARGRLKTSLEGQYGTDEVQSFMETFDDMNKRRINEGLQIAKDKLLQATPEKRMIMAASERGMYAMFEALNCVPFLQDDQALQSSFDEPFELAQSRKKVKLPGYSPGMVSFLYTPSGIRSTWAHRNFAVLDRVMTPTEFDYSVEPFLRAALSRVHIYNLDERFLPSFWKATHAVLTRLDTELVTTKLAALEDNIWKMSLEHFQLNMPHFNDLIQSYTVLLEKGPQQFWRSMDTIGPQSVLDTIFKAPKLDQAMSSIEVDEDGVLKVFSWVDPFIGSIQANNLVPPVRTIADQFLRRYQVKQYSQKGREIAFEVGLRAVLKALRTLQEGGNKGPLISQLLDFISKEHLPTIMQQLDGVEKKDEMRLSKRQDVCLQIIELALILDCRSIGHDRLSITETEGVDYQASVSDLSIWKQSLRGIKPGHPTMAAAVLVGMKELVGLDRFSPRQVEKWKKPAAAYNEMLSQVDTYIIEDLLERLQSFSSEQLAELSEDQRAIPGLFALLFNGEQPVHQAALDLFKTITGEDSRRATLMQLAKRQLRTTLHGTASAVMTIARWKSYTPCSNMLKLITDVYNCLCDDTDGLLRSGSEHSKEDLVALERLWQASWMALKVIFDTTEAWSQLGHNKQELENFCRATMDCAELVFDQLPLIASALARQTATDTISKRLLERPKDVFLKITTWLRLRDDYLITRAVRLTCALLSRLKDSGIIVSEDAASVAEGVLTGKVKTRMSVNQKAEIQRSLEYHFGESFEQSTGLSAAVSKKQASLQDWTSSAQTSGRSTPTETTKPSKPGTIDVSAWSAAAAKNKNHASDALKSLLDKSGASTAQFRQQLELTKPVAAKPPMKTAKAMDEERRKLEFKMKRQHDKEEADRRRAEALAKAKGIGAGSGVQGLGNIGKDHSLKGQNVMVSSDEGSDSEGDDFDRALFGESIKKKARTDTIGLGLKHEAVRGPTKIHRTQRSAKDMRARLAPNLQPLHRIILKWDFFHDGDFPPASKEHEFKGVSNVYHDPSSYQDTFQPLLTLEAWQGMVKAREENSSKAYEIKIQARSNVDHFIEISSSVTHAENRDLQLQEGDIILLSKSKKPQENAEAAHCLARIYRIKRQKAHLETVYQVMPGSSLERVLAPQAVIHGVKVQSIIPLEREYGALQALQYYDLCNQIVRAKPSARMTFSEKQIAAYQDNWNVNRAQAEAVNAALVNEGFSLIQGPPGSGKTKTIVAIVGGLLSDQLGSTAKATKINVPGQTNGRSNDAPAKKLLICAPSNAAVDELVKRMKDGVKTKSGRVCPVNIVRIGRSDAINSQVLDVTMDELVSKQLGTSTVDQDGRAKHQELFKEHERISAELRSLHEQRDSGEAKGTDVAELRDKIAAVRKRKNELGSKIDNVKDQERTAGREAELNRKRAQQAVLDQAHVICATLSGSGHDLFQSMSIEFETVIIDEAAQCVEMSSLIPLKYGCVKCIMVGDPKQLPPTVFSREAARFQYEQSLFVRMQNNFPKEVHLLDTQYRMHPDISIFPSRTFYDGLLKDGKGMAGLRKQPWHASELLAPYRFFDVQGQHQTSAKGRSLVNTAEVDVAMALYSRLRSDFGTYDLTGKVGIITTYKAQLKLLKDRFSTKYGRDIFETIEFNTTDAFQGRESEIIIFSCVRASPAGGIGFLQDIRRMNVGLTRAKSSLWVLGNSDSLVRGRYWKMLVEDARSRDAYTTGDILRMLSAPSSKYQASAHKDRSMHDVSTHQQQIKSSTTGGKEAEAAASDRRHESDSRMEGITYRFEDRLKTKRSAPDEGTQAAGRARLDVSDGDTEMTDAASPNALIGDRSRNSTPTPPTMKINATAAGPNGVKQVPTAPVAPGPVKTIRRPAADPFIRPRKR